jgi:aspartyl-tRNA(Asn)/glutamyl-tRNA(Gln) amidotransferase subunit C
MQPMPREPADLSADEVRRIARLARLQPTDAEIERYRTQLASILEHVGRLNELDVAGVEPLTHPFRDGDVAGSSNRFESDDPQPPLPLEALTVNAPAMEGRFVAVPKVLGAGGDEGGG